MSDGDSDVSLTDSEWAVRQAGGEDGAAQQARPGRSEPATETVETGARARAQSAVKDLTSPQRTAVDRAQQARRQCRCACRAQGGGGGQRKSGDPGHAC